VAGEARDVVLVIILCLVPGDNENADGGEVFDDEVFGGAAADDDDVFGAAPQVGVSIAP
jgi:hypothetical protein